MAKAKKRAPRRKKATAGSIGLSPAETKSVDSKELGDLPATVEADGGAVLGTYRDPFGGTPVLLVALPINRVEPTPYQRDPSDTHIKKLMNVIEKVGRFLDPLVLIRQDEAYWTPNGNHRLQAMKKLGVKSIVALLVPDPEVAFKILALNTEKAHNVKEKSLETIRMARALAARKEGKEEDFAFEFEQPQFLTLGAAYEQKKSLSGGAYTSVLRRIDGFLEEPMAKALKERERRGNKVLVLDEAVGKVVDALKAKGLTSPYLKAFVVARINYIRFSKATEFDFDEVMDKITGSAKKFNIEKVKQEDVAKAGGGPAAEED
jgi:ParB family chromosome partitioning protein